MATLAVNIDPSGAERGARRVTRSMDDIKRSSREVERSTSRIGGVANDNFSSMARGANVATIAIRGLAGAAAGLVAAFSLQAAVTNILRTTDAVKQVNAQLRLAVGAGDEFAAMQERLFSAAQQTNSAYGSTVELFARLARSTDQLGISHERLAQVTETVNRAFIVSGASAQEAQSAIVQLSQGLAAGALRGEELNSVLEQGPRLARAIADGLGVTVGQLRELAQEGQLTAETVVSALESQAGAIEREFGTIDRTIGAAVTNLSNEWMRFVESLDATYDISGSLVSVIDGVAGSLDGLAESLPEIIEQAETVGTVLLAAFAPSIAASVLRLSTALAINLVGALNAVKLAIATNPLGALAVVATTAAAAIYQLTESASAAEQATTTANAAFQRAAAEINNGSNAANGYSVALRNVIAMELEAAQAALTAADATFVAANARAQAFKALTGFEFAPFEYGADVAKQEADALAGSVYNLETQLAEVDSNLADAQQNFEKAASGLRGVGTAGGAAAKGISSAGGAARQADQEFEQFARTADQLAEKLFPAEYARREADKLFALLDEYGAKLDQFQRAAVEQEIGDLYRASEMGLRRLEDTAGDSFGAMGDSAQERLGDVISNIFSGGIESFEDFLDEVLRGFAQIGQQNIQNLFSRDGGGVRVAANDNFRANTTLGEYLGYHVERGAQKGAAVGASQGGFLGIVNGFGSLFAPGSVGGGLASAGLGGVGLGYESGNPIMGAIGGAVSGFSAGSSIAALGAMGGPIGAVVGGIAGLLGGLFGSSKKKREERKKAQQELDSQMGQITGFLDEISGIFAGEYLTRFREVSDELQKVRDLAAKAGDRDLVREIDDATERFWDHFVEDWNRNIDGVLASMEAGTGFEGAFVKASQAIQDLGEKLVGFVEDAKFMAEANGDLDKAMELARGQGLTANNDPVISFDYNKSAGIPGEYIDFVNRNTGLFQELAFAPYTKLTNTGSETGPRGGRAVFESLNGLRVKLRELGVEFDEFGEPLTEASEAAKLAMKNQMAELERYQRGAQATALATLSGARTFTAIEERIEAFKGTAAGLKTVLEDLGMTSDEATAAIDAHLQIAMEGLIREYENSLQRSINEARGADFINEVADAQAIYNERMKDAAALGLSTDSALQELNLRLAEIAGAADLSEGQLKALAEVFPEIASSLLGVDTKDPARTIADAQEAVERAQSDLRRAYEEQLSEIERNIDALERFIDSLSEFRDGLRLSGVSPLGQKDQVDEARRQFNEVAAAAMSGDQEAMEKLQGVSQAYLDEARAYYTSSEAYFSIFEQVENILDRTLDKAGTQLTEAQRQRSLLEEQVGKLIDINDAVLTVADAIAALASAQGGMSDAEKELIDFITGQKDTINNSVPSNVDRLYRDVLGRPAEQAGIDFWRSIVGSGALTDEMYKLFVDVARRNGEAIMPDYQGYAAGGMHMGGLRLVGERGPELEATGPARIWSHDQTRQMFSGGGNDALLEEVRALRRDNAEMRAELKRLTAVSFEGHQQTTSAVREGNDISADVASDLRRQSSKAA